jgi:hypothetical protein
MGVRPAELRLAKWDAKLSGDALSPVVAALKPMMKDQLTVRFGEIVSVEDACGAVLNDGGILAIQRGGYQSFARTLYSLMRKFSGTTLLNEADIQLRKWVGYGLDEETLEKIRTAVFGLVAPTP